MKNRLLPLLLAAVFGFATMQGVPAYPYPLTVTQPDGSSIALLGHGDEYYNFITTDDGYTVVQDNRGYYTYAVRDGERLIGSGVVAHSPAVRDASERAFVSTLQPRLTDRGGVAAAKKMRAERDHIGARRVQTVDYDNFRGLVVLINFSDTKFHRNDINNFYDRMLNEHGYNGYTSENGRDAYYDRYGRMFIGSVRDYYYQNSNEIFDPKFDVVGPVDIDMPADSVHQTWYAQDLFRAALRDIDPTVDFSRYDNDGDGAVDMVFFMVAGYGSNFMGNNSDYLWPHMSALWMQPMDGVFFGRYACSVEMYGLESWGVTIPDGIGTFCHEFTHVLGFPDLYDTDYEENGGESHHPGDWDIMSGGSYAEYGRKPVGFTAFERYSFGFNNPVVIDEPGHYVLHDVQSSNEGIILPTPVEGEFFMLDNRQLKGWDQMLPGHGMLVARVDSTDERMWDYNMVNNFPEHNYYELLRAGRGTSGESDSDPFPGTSNVDSLRNNTNPSLRTWGGVFNNYAITNIVERNGVLEFDVERDDEIMSIVEDFESMPATTDATASGVQGVFAKWDFTQCFVTDPGEEIKHNGEHAVAMKKPSALTTATAVNLKAVLASAMITNPTGTDATFRLYYSTDDGATWSVAEPGEMKIGRGTTSTPMWTLNITTPAKYRIYEMGGSTARCYVDDFTLYYSGKCIVNPYDINDDGYVNVTDVNLLVSAILLGDKDAKYDVNDDDDVTVTDVNLVVSYILTNQ